MEEDSVILKSQEGQDFNVPLYLAKMSNTIKDLIEDSGTSDPIPIITDSKTLAKVIEWAKYHHEHPLVVQEAAKDEKRSDDICPWDLDFCKMSQPDLISLIQASNYLAINDLLDLCCKTVANMIKGKMVEQIRTTLNLVNDFTKEEEAAIKLETEWCED